MVDEELKRLPGAEIVLAGVEDLRHGRQSIYASAVQAAAGRLRDVGLQAPGTRMYLTGGATALLEGWRSTTVDIDIRFEPDSDAALRRIADLKEELSVSIEEELFRFPAVDPSRLRAAVESLAQPGADRGLGGA